MTGPVTLGSFVRDLRTRRGVSLRQLADRALVARRTLSYWEAGTHLPRLPELEAVLTALSATPQERAQAFALLGTPRAAQRVEREFGSAEWASRFGPLPTGGDLLRAMRARKRLPLDEAARRLGVAPSTLSRWERGQTPPDSERLAHLLDVLSAHPQERAALLGLGGHFHLLEPTLEAVTDFGALREGLDAFLLLLSANPLDKLHDLRFLTFQARAWPVAARSDAGRELLAEIYARRAYVLSLSNRFPEALTAADRALSLMPNGGHGAAFMLQAVIAAAQAQARGGSVSRTLEAVRLLRRWQETVTDPAYAAWMLAEQAEHLCRIGETRAAVEAATRACQIAEHAQPIELRLRQHDLAAILIRCGRPENALDLVHDSAEDTAFWRALVALLRAEGLLLAGDVSAAHDWLTRVYGEITAGDLDHLQAQADALAQRF